MINLKTFFRNHFDTKEISDNKMKKFTEDHLQRLLANNPEGIYDTIISETTSAYNNYFGVMSTEDLAHANQQAKTIAMNNVVEEFKKAVRQKEGLIRANWDKDTPMYQNFFPYGLSEYGKANLSNVLTLMQRFEVLVIENVAVLGQDTATLFTGIKNRFIDAREDQLNKKGEVSGLKESTSVNRDELETRLMKNVFIIALDHIGDELGGMIYFDQSFIKGKSNKQQTPVPEPF